MLKRFEGVVNMLPWLQKKKTQQSESATASSSVTHDVQTHPSEERVRTLGETSMEEFEQMLGRVEVAKKIAEVREHHDGVNRNRIKRLFRAISLIALGATLMLLLPLPSPKTKLPMDKITLGAVVPIAALPSGQARKGHIAIFKVAGTIDGTLHGAVEASNTPLSLATAFESVEADPDLAGVIIEIDSFGGGAAASAQSYRIVKAARERLLKRKVRMIAHTSLGAYSGGYYIAMGVGHGNFFADPSAEVANIGVIMSMFNTAGVGELFGVTENVISTGPLKSTGNQWEKLTLPQRVMLQEAINDSFAEFLLAVSESRQIDMATLIREAQLPVGRTNGAWFPARRALDNGLIDGVVPVETLYSYAASILPEPRQWTSIEFVEYRLHNSVLERATGQAGRASGVFINSMFSKMTHRDVPVRSEKQ